MPLPFILGAAAAAAAVGGVASGINGGKKMKDANDTMKEANRRHEANQKRMEGQNNLTTADMDRLGQKEMEMLASLEKFSDTFEKIQNRPQFKNLKRDNVDIPDYDPDELKKISVGATVLLSGLAGAAVGTAGGFAAAGATTAAVMALGTASTGTAIASLSGAAATNAALAALGGGAIAAGGGGMALGTAVLGASTLGVGLLVGGIIFNVAGGTLSDKADEAWDQMLRAERQINKICDYLKELSSTAKRFHDELCFVDSIYRRYLNRLVALVGRKQDWLMYTEKEQTLVENTVLLVGLIVKMCKVRVTSEETDAEDMREINTAEVGAAIADAEKVLEGLPS